jgi:twitching motility protein PilT
MIDAINKVTTRNVITVEDPIEFLHRDRLSFIHQREVGLDTRSFHDGLRYVLRQDPDIILVGEIRDLETMNTALMAADTGHLVLSTLHTTDVVQTLQRVISFYPPHQHDEIRMSVATNLRAVICQRLIARADGAGRVPAIEIMVNTPTIREFLINPDKLPMIHSAVADGVTQYGMQTFDQSVLALLREGSITEEEALKNCNNPNELELKLKGISATSDRLWRSVDDGALETAATQPDLAGIDVRPPIGPRG